MNYKQQINKLKQENYNLKKKLSDFDYYSQKSIRSNDDRIKALIMGIIALGLITILSIGGYFLI